MNQTNHSAHGANSESGSSPEHGSEELNVWMYVGIVVVSLTAFYVTMLITKMAY